MRLTRILIPLVMAAAAALLGAVPAQAQPYPVGTPVVTVSASLVVSGNSITFRGDHFGPNDRITIDIAFLGGPASSAQRLVAQADADGSFSIVIRLDGEGTVVITATGDPSGVHASATVRLSRKILPVTGSDGSTLRMVVGGGAAVVGGAALVALAHWRRRRRPA